MVIKEIPSVSRASKEQKQLNREPRTGATVIILCPGGLEQGGGIGRQMGYLLQECQNQTSGTKFRVVDSRGPWFLGASPLYIGFAAIYLAGAALKLLAAGRSAARPMRRPCQHHRARQHRAQGHPDDGGAPLWTALSAPCP